jgi:hypothetical protein
METQRQKNQDKSAKEHVPKKRFKPNQGKDFAAEKADLEKKEKLKNFQKSI